MRLAVAVTAVVLFGAALAPHAQDDPAAEEKPRDVGLVETSGARLAQVDITVLGPPEIVANLTPEDFRIRVQFTHIDDFTLDRYCTPATLLADGSASAVTGGATASPRTVAAPRPPSTFLFYTDQILLTLQGRQNAISLLRQLIEELIRDGNRGMLISNAKELAVLQPLTDDPAALMAAVERLEHDRTQWHEYATLEDSRVNDLVEQMNGRGEISTRFAVERAVGIARRYQMEETWRAEKSMRRLTMTLLRLTDEPPPKAVFYFSDIMRQNAGEHYGAFFGDRMRTSRMALAQIESDALAVHNVFDKIVSEASAQGIRFYPVLSRGLIESNVVALPSAAAQNATLNNHSGSRARYYESRDSLANLATETGGYAFLNGQSAVRMAERIAKDFSCLYIASFDPAGFREDHPLRIIVNTPRDDITVRARGRLVVQSESARRTSQLVNAFASHENGVDDPLEVRSNVVPTGFRNGDFTALLQISVPPAPLQGATWDLGASVITRDKVNLETSGRLSVPMPGLPVVFEKELTFGPGSYEVISVAHEATTGLISSNQLDLDWPDPRKRPATASPIAVLQPVSGAFLRGEETRKSGSLAHGANEALHTELPTALVSLVCRGRKNKDALTIGRTLVGASEVDFPTISPDFDDETCAQIRDLVPANTLGEGYYRYRITVRNGDDETLEEIDREFFAVAPTVR